MWIIVEGADVVIDRYTRRAASVIPNVEWMHGRVMEEAERGYRDLSQGIIPTSAMVKYYKDNGVGMYGRGSVPSGQADYIINPQPRDDGSTPWLEGFRVSSGPTAGGGWSSALHNDAVTTPYDASPMPLAKAFREGWHGPTAMMRPRGIAAMVSEYLMDQWIPTIGRQAIRAIIAGRQLS